MKNILKQNIKPLLIAEISGNHNGNKKRFLNLIESAFKNGADMVKIQTYEPKDITLKTHNKKFMIKKGIWGKEYLWDLYEKAHTLFDGMKMLLKLQKYRVNCLVVHLVLERWFLENLMLSFTNYFEITDFKLIDYIAQKNKPILISLGFLNARY